MSNHENRFLKCGPGGLHCRCCAPPPGKLRRKALRAQRRRARLAAFRVEAQNGGV